MESTHPRLCVCLVELQEGCQPIFPAYLIPSEQHPHPEVGAVHLLAMSRFCFMVLAVDEDATMLAPNQTLSTEH